MAANAWIFTTRGCQKLFVRRCDHAWRCSSHGTFVSGTRTWMRHLTSLKRFAKPVLSPRMAPMLPAVPPTPVAVTEGVHRDDQQSCRVSTLTSWPAHTSHPSQYVEAWRCLSTARVAQRERKPGQAHWEVGGMDAQGTWHVAGRVAARLRAARGCFREYSRSNAGRDQKSKTLSFRGRPHTNATEPGTVAQLWNQPSWFDVRIRPQQLRPAFPVRRTGPKC